MSHKVPRSLAETFDERFAAMEPIRRRTIVPDGFHDRNEAIEQGARAEHDDPMPDMADRDCCQWHNRNCEPPSELCCGDCTEAMHPGHTDGSKCAAPDLSSRKRFTVRGTWEFVVLASTPEEAFDAADDAPYNHRIELGRMLYPDQTVVEWPDD